MDEPKPVSNESDSGPNEPTAGPEAASPEVAGPEAEAAGPEAEAAGPEAVGPEAEAAGPEAVGPKAVGPEAAGPEAAGPEAAEASTEAPASTESPAAAEAAGPEAPASTESPAAPEVASESEPEATEEAEAAPEPAKPPMPAPPEDVEPAAGMLFSFVVGLATLSLLCVVSAVIAALVVPKLGGVQAQENDQAAIEALEAIARAQHEYQSKDLDGNGRPDFAGLGRLGMLGLIDPDLSSGVKNGYVFKVVVSELDAEKRWMAIAQPMVTDRTGQRSFAINHAGAVYYQHGGSINLNTRTCAMPPNVLPVR